MGIKRTSIFLHAFASSSGVRVGGTVKPDESDAPFEVCSRWVTDAFSSVVDIGEGE